MPGGIPEFVTDGETGLLVGPGRPDALAAGLNRLLGAPGLRHDLAAAARRVVVAHHTLAARADAVAGVYWSAGPDGGAGGRSAVRTLMVTKFLPLPDNNGGRQRSLAIARRLAGLGDVVLCGYDDGSADRSGLRDLGIDVRAVPWRLTPVGIARGVAGDAERLGGTVLERGHARDRPPRRRPRRRSTCCRSSTSRWCPSRSTCPAKTSVLDLHNVESALVASYARARRGVPAALLRAEAAALRRMERRTIGEFDHVVVVSEEERARLPAEARSVLVCPNGREPSAVLPDADGGDRGLRGHHGVGAQRRCRRVARPRDLAPGPGGGCPRPGSCWWARDPAPAVRALAGGNVQVTGTVADVTPYLAQARVVVAPLRAGGGTRLKIMEALDVGRPVVATSVGCEGMEDLVGRGVVVADTAAGLAEAIAGLLVDPARASALGRAGHDAVAADHTWDAALAPLLEAVRPC